MVRHTRRAALTISIVILHLCIVACLAVGLAAVLVLARPTPAVPAATPTAGTGAFQIAADILTRRTATWQEVVSIGDFTPREHSAALLIDDSGTAHFVLTDGFGLWDVHGGPTVTDGGWHRLAGERTDDGRSVRLTVDGVTVGATTTRVTVDLPAGLHWGADLLGTRLFSGVLRRGVFVWGASSLGANLPSPPVTTVE